MEKAFLSGFVRGLAAPLDLYSAAERFELKYAHRSFEDAMRADQLRIREDAKKSLRAIFAEEDEGGF